jgi:4-amino-4-deoxy-L-arabinose transferase-like glycosyltransferase
VRLDYASREPRAGTWTVDGRLLVLLLVGAGLRLGWIAHVPTDDAAIDRLPDQREYLELGRSLLNGDGLVFVDPRFTDTVYAYRAPAYPWLIALCQADLHVIRVVQALLDTLTILGAYILARRWLDKGPSVFAAFVVMINPFLIYFCGLILSETLFTAMLVWGMALLVMRRPADLNAAPRWGIAWWCGAILLSFSILVRPSAIALPVVLGIAAAFVNRDWRLPYDWRWTPPVATLMVLLTALVLLPWGWRNHRILGSWVWTTTNGGITLYDGLNPDATGASNQSFVRTMPQLRSMNEVDRSKYLADLAWQFVREHPDRALQLSIIKIARTISPIPLSEEYGRNPRTLIVAATYMIPLYVLVVMGLWLAPAGRSIKVYLLAPALYFIVAHSVSVGSLRYRIPADVPMTIIAAMGAASLKRRNDQIPMTNKAPMPNEQG